MVYDTMMLILLFGNGWIRTFLRLLRTQCELPPEKDNLGSVHEIITDTAELQLTSSSTNKPTAQGVTNNYGHSMVQLRSQSLRAVVADFFLPACTAVPYDLAEGRNDIL